MGNLQDPEEIRNCNTKIMHCTKMKFSFKNFFPQFPADLVIFTEEILNRKLHFCAVMVDICENFQNLKQLGR